MAGVEGNCLSQFYLRMRLKLYWYLSAAYKDGILRPACTYLKPQRDLDEFIANYLMDDGGVFYLETISSLANGLCEIALLNEKMIQLINFGRNAW
ncbi:hypothetical protein [Variovorax sp. 770b2]|uniref:hypothetical protein n=1 Tax=Variovorax sp. 770b2 TaxID=1566271 RepID=UPI001160D759|nr:hypothetical protein [Variovorax sp. 770b2]